MGRRHRRPARPEKDQALLVDAMAPLLDARRHLVIVGDGPEREAHPEARRRTARGIRAPDGSVLERGRDARGFRRFALTSKTEGLPLVLLEAMATELPVVSSAVGGIPDVIEHGATGFLFRSGGRNALTKELVELFGSPTSLGMGAAWQAIAQSHSLERMTESYDALYREVVARTGGNHPVIERAAGANDEPRDSGARDALLHLRRLPALRCALGARRAAGVQARRLRADRQRLLAVHDGAGISPKAREPGRPRVPAGKLEFLICSDGSSDDTERIARDWAPRPAHPRALESDAARKARRPESHASVAKGEVVLMTDVRQTLHPKRAPRPASTARGSDVGCVSGSLVLDGDTGASAYWRYERFIRGSEARVGAMVGVSGSLYAMRRADLTELPEDVLLDDMFIPLCVALAEKASCFATRPGVRPRLRRRA